MRDNLDIDPGFMMWLYWGGVCLVSFGSVLAFGFNQTGLGVGMITFGFGAAYVAAVA